MTREKTLGCIVENKGPDLIVVQFEPEGDSMDLPAGDMIEVLGFGSPNPFSLVWHSGIGDTTLRIFDEIGSDYSVVHKGVVVREAASWCKDGDRG